MTRHFTLAIGHRPILVLMALVACLFAGAKAPVAVAAEPVAEPKPEHIEFFETKIRPVLVAHCYDCHSESAAASKKLKGGLRVDHRAGLLVGGDSGPAIVPRAPQKSFLISALRHEDWQMPPKGKLPDAVIADFVKWIELGAPDPRTTRPTSKAPSPTATRPDPSTHWAFQPLAKSPLAKVAFGDGIDEWSRNGIDRFIQAKLQSNGLQPSPETDRVTLIRRATLDLIGLPPTLEEVDAFANDSEPDAYERVIDRLLASPHYGERWGRHWLDLARYADSSGFHNDLDRPTAWRYRDYVVSSLNDDKPYSRFVAEQLAGDEVDAASDETLVATGFCRNGPSNDDNMGNDKEKYRLDQLDDVVSTTSSVFLGLTLGCARCHDHKYDPLPTEDYYRFLAIFNSTVKHGGVEHIKENQKTKDAKSTPLALIETSPKSKQTFVLLRGNHKTPGRQVEPGIPAVLASRTTPFALGPSPEKTTGQRRALAAWITSPDNGLTYRVLANRLWQHYFGRGIVETTSNFGLGGSTPTHPELLDFLATQLIENAGQIKAIHKLIVTSATYRQRSDNRSVDDSAAKLREAKDPGNELYWRQNVRRLEAEAIRDCVLAASGNMNPQMSGPGIKPRMRAELITASQRNKWPTIVTENPSHWRRSVYIYVKRQLLMPMMELFDSPTTTDSCAVRSSSVLPTQALIMMNDEFIEDQAAYLARRSGSQSTVDLAIAIDTAHRLTIGRSPSRMRVNRSISFVEQQVSTYRQEGMKTEPARHKAMTDLCHVLLNSSEFVFVD